MAAPMTVLRIEKLKSWGSVGGAGEHNMRTRPTPNADPARSHLNRYLVGSPDDDLPAVVRAKIGTQTIRKNAVLAVEAVLSASPEYFRPTAPEAGGTWDEKRLEAWVEASEAWLQKKYGDRLVSVLLHLDETTPHIQAVFVPLDDHGKLNCRALLGGSRQTLRDLQSDYAKDVAHLGIERGVPGSKAQHTTIRDYYASMDAGEREVFNLETFDEALQLASSQIARAERLEKEVEQLRSENSKLIRERKVLKNELAQLRGTDLTEVLERMYGAEEAKDSKTSHKSRKFKLGEHGSIGVTGELWIDNATGKGGKGALNLVMHMEGYSDVQRAARLMLETFSVDNIMRDLGRRVAVQDKTVYRSLADAMPVPLPDPAPLNWMRVRRYLVEERALPDELVDWAHQLGLLYADDRANAVFVRDGGGCFKRGSYDPKGKPAFKQTLGRDAGAFVLPGNADKVIVCEGAIDALSLKAISPEATVLATGGNCPVERIAGALASAKRVILAHDADASGETQAARLRGFCEARGVEVERHAPKRGTKDWNDALRLKPTLSRFEIINGQPARRPDAPKPQQPGYGM